MEKYGFFYEDATIPLYEHLKFYFSFRNKNGIYLVFCVDLMEEKKVYLFFGRVWFANDKFFGLSNKVDNLVKQLPPTFYEKLTFSNLDDLKSSFIEISIQLEKIAPQISHLSQRDIITFETSPDGIQSLGKLYFGENFEHTLRTLKT